MEVFVASTSESHFSRYNMYSVVSQEGQVWLRVNFLRVRKVFAFTEPTTIIPSALNRLQTIRFQFSQRNVFL